MGGGGGGWRVGLGGDEVEGVKNNCWPVFNGYTIGQRRWAWSVCVCMCECVWWQPTISTWIGQLVIWSIFPNQRVLPLFNTLFLCAEASPKCTLPNYQSRTAVRWQAFVFVSSVRWQAFVFVSSTHVAATAIHLANTTRKMVEKGPSYEYHVSFEAIPPVGVLSTLGPFLKTDVTNPRELYSILSESRPQGTLLTSVAVNPQPAAKLPPLQSSSEVSFG